MTFTEAWVTGIVVVLVGGGVIASLSLIWERIRKGGKP